MVRVGGARVAARVSNPERVSSLLTHLRNYDEAIRIMQRAAFVPKDTRINYHEQVRIRVFQGDKSCMTFHRVFPFKHVFSSR